MEGKKEGRKEEGRKGGREEGRKGGREGVHIVYAIDKGL
jgi:hypothetical protein